MPTAISTMRGVFQAMTFLLGVGRRMVSGIQKEGCYALRARRHGETVVAQLLLKHRDRRPRITLLALGDRDAGVEIDRGATPRILAQSELLDERLAVGRVAHFGLRVTACGDAHASDQRRDRSD